MYRCCFYDLFLLWYIESLVLVSDGLNLLPQKKIFSDKMHVSCKFPVDSYGMWSYSFSRRLCFCPTECVTTGDESEGVYYVTLVDNIKHHPIIFLEKEYKITVQKSWKIIYVFLVEKLEHMQTTRGWKIIIVI